MREGFRLTAVFTIILVITNILGSTKGDENSNSFLSEKRYEGSLKPLLTRQKSKLTYRDHYHHKKNCEGSEFSPIKLTVTYNEPLGLSVTVNDTSETAYLIDFNNNVGLLLNGQNGIGILMDHNAKLAYKLEGVWLSSKEPIAKFFQSITSLKPLLEAAKQKGHGTSLSNPSNDIGHEIALGFTNLAGSYQPKDIEDYYGTTMTTAIRGLVKVFYQGTGSFGVNKDLKTQVKLNLALAHWLAAADEIDSIGTLDAGHTFASKSGLSIFLNFLDEINEHTDIAKVFKTLLTSQQVKFFRLITEIEKAVSQEGVDGFDTLLTDLILLLSGKGSLKETINDLLRYTPNDDLNLTVMRCYVDRIEAILRKSIDTYQNQDVLGWLYEFVVTKTTGRLSIFNVNIADLVDLLLAKNLGQLIPRVVKVLGQLLSPQNIPYIIQWFLNKDEVPDSLTLVFPIASRRFRDANDVLLDTPGVRLILPQILELQFNITKTINETINNDLGIILNDLSSGSIGAATNSFIQGIMKDIRNFFVSICNRLGFSDTSFRSALLTSNEGKSFLLDHDHELVKGGDETGKSQ